MATKITGTNTAAAPGVTGDDTDTGLFYGTNEIGFSTGGTSRLTLDSSGYLNVPDNGKIRLGTGNDLEISHNGSQSLIDDVGTGALVIRSNNAIDIKSSDNEMMAAFNKDADVKLYFNNSVKLETTSGGVSVTGDIALSSHLDMEDGKAIKLGTGDDFQLHHTSGVNYIDCYADLLIRNETSETMIDCNRNGSVELFYDGSKKLETKSYGLTLHGNVLMTNTDSQILKFGASNDLEISHNGTDNIIDCKNDKNLKIVNDAGGGNESMVVCDPNGGVELFYNGTKHFETTAAGVKVDHTTSGDTIAMVLRHGRGGLSGYAGKAVSFVGNDSTEEGSIVIGTTSTAYNTSSDYRLKENQVAISDGITRLKTLKPYRFNFKKDPDVTVDGFFAHEVTAVPEAITGEKDKVITQSQVDDGSREEADLGKPEYQQIDQSKLVPLLTAALQEAIGKIEVLETKVATLEAG